MLERFNNWLDEPFKVKFTITKREVGFYVLATAVLIGLYFSLKIAFSA